MNKHLAYGVIGLLIILWVFREGCNCSSDIRKDREIANLKKELESKPPAPELVRVDTVKVTDTIPEYIPVPHYVKGDPVPFPVPETTFVDRTDPNYLAYLIRVEKDYRTKIPYLDSILTDYGWVYILDTLRNNRIISRQPWYVFKAPEYHYIQPQPPAKNSNLWFAGILLQGGPGDWISGAGGGFGMVNKKRHLMYSIDALYDRHRHKGLMENLGRDHPGILFQTSFKMTINR